MRVGFFDIALSFGRDRAFSSSLVFAWCGFSSSCLGGGVKSQLQRGRMLVKTAWGVR
jgi:hypothetical protein